MFDLFDCGCFVYDLLFNCCLVGLFGSLVYFGICVSCLWLCWFGDGFD